MVWKQMRVPADLNMSKAVGPKGSYRAEHVITCLERWLEPWTALRASTGNWRILRMDAYRAHMGQELVGLCVARGYILLFHYGCTTGIAQVNDTDLHAEFSRQYLDMESASFFEK